MEQSSPASQRRGHMGAAVSSHIIVDLARHIRISDQAIRCFANLAHYTMSGC